MWKHRPNLLTSFPNKVMSKHKCLLSPLKPFILVSFLHFLFLYLLSPLKPFRLSKTATSPPHHHHPRPSPSLSSFFIITIIVILLSWPVMIPYSTLGSRNKHISRQQHQTKSGFFFNHKFLLNFIFFLNLMLFTWIPRNINQFGVKWVNFLRKWF
jgi:hypothetical protein